MLESVVSDLAAPLLRVKAVVTVAGDLNIARRNWNAYPSGHPLIESSVQKLLTSFQSLLSENGGVQLGITRDGLLLGDEYVEKNNQICKNVAAAFFERGIGALIVSRLPDREELLALLALLSLKREDVLAQGGIEKLWQEAGITALEIRAIRYDRFSGTEEERLSSESDQEHGSLWEQFVLLMTKGEVGLAGTDAQGEIRPEVLAASLNAHFARRLGSGSGLSNNTLRRATAIIQQAIAVSDTGDNGAARDAGYTEEAGDWSELNETAAVVKADLVAFITALDPLLRRQILNGFCETGAADASTADELFRYLGATVLQETYASADEYAAAPELLQGILRKLLPHLMDSYHTTTRDDEVRDRMQTLLQEHQREAYMPDAYMQGLLDSLNSGALKQLDTTELASLLTTLSPAFINSRGSEIILQLVIADPTSETAQELIQNLADLCGHFLELGDYGQVLKILSQAADPRLPQLLRTTMRDAFCRREFLDEILSGLTVWGKPKYDQVALLIQVLGRAFIEPLLDRMAEEENMSLRRFMMDRVQSFGEIARPYLLARLSDSRWYVLRNIIVMLRALGPMQENELVRPLLRHANQKVRVEALKLLIQSGDPVAQRQVLRDLDSSDREIQLIAINMADRNSPPEMMRKLLALATGGGYTAVECELKSAAIQALAEIGRSEILPELVKVLTSRSLLAFKALNRLKIDIIRSLDRYPAKTVLPLLEKVADGNDEVARQAAETLRILRSKTS
ncbi:HEAT repeat domain-containing protein [Trichlorobacter lovleyi]|uniref:PBS lyase heat-like repeat protein n=1 Tax=Trichlorobacter lovleyi (strain ATCC BAA-1151 / DSM 17278 / SZ) TaxID=398767 RepID=B3E3D7_TRIL1|nr:HEAT repeat domain-containing protein [Trichlorobacter lovleyi]ACD95756.1 PBS lyase heat-like repeat protein [Trichlorobacter lovleyi SZ]